VFYNSGPITQYRPHESPRLFKRRRLNRPYARSINRRSSSTFGYSTRTETPSNPFTYSGTLLGKKQYRNLLWNASLLKQHYHSILMSSRTLTTPTGTITATVDSVGALNESAGAQFWKTVGGAMDSGFGDRPTWMNAPGVGVPEPVTIIIRGGRLFTQIASLSTTDTIKVRCQLAFTKSQLRNTTDTASSNTLTDWLTNVSATSRPISWTVTDMPDYLEYMHPPVLDRQMDLKPADDFMITYKIKPAKIDADAFDRGSGWYPMWFFYVSQTIDTTVGTNAVAVNFGHNLSFAMMDTLDS